MATITPLDTISPIDGRYATKTQPLQSIWSEAGLMRHRLTVEVQWLCVLAQPGHLPDLAPIAQEDVIFLESLVTQFDAHSAAAVKTIEKVTNHDVKAIEYFLREKIAAHPRLQHYSEFVHFACTSEDINNLAYALMLKTSRQDILLPIFAQLQNALSSFAGSQADIPMLSRTHGQAATPTTLGKEWANFAYRMRLAINTWQQVPIFGKCNGAVGNFNAHLIAYPDIDWQQLSRNLVENIFNLTFNPYTTQIEPHDYIANYCHALIRINTILIDLCRDVWGYISLGFFTQTTVAGEIGSSTMPHKVNPIDFENAEGNLGLANTLLEHFALKLPISRWQRDLTDSTVLRSMGTALAHSLLAYQSLSTGLKKLVPAPSVIAADLADRWEILAEPLQTVMRRYGIADAYEQLKTLTRGKTFTQATYSAFVAQLAIPELAKQQLAQLTPSNYIGLAATLARDLASLPDLNPSIL